MKRSGFRAILGEAACWVIYLALLLHSLIALASAPKAGTSSLDALTFSKPELWITAQPTDLTSLGGQAPPALVEEWGKFLQAQNKAMSLIIDRVTGKPSIIGGEGIPWIPGTANGLTATDLGLALGLQGKDIPPAIVSTKSISLLKQFPNLFGIDPTSLVLNLRRSGPMLDYLYYLSYDWTHYGIPVEHAGLTFRMNHGNLIHIGQNFVCDSIQALNPSPSISSEAAWSIIWNYVGGSQPDDLIIEPGRLSIIPVSTPAVLAGQLVAPGAGLTYRLVHTVVFQRPVFIGTWEARVDAHSGEILSFMDANLYGHIQGGVYRTDGYPAETMLPFPYADYGASAYANAAGNFAGSSGTGTMTGPLSGGPGFPGGVGIDSSQCGEIDETANASGIIDFGVGSGSDCAVPSGKSAGDTHAARTTYWHITQMKMKAMTYFPPAITGPYPWLATRLPVIVNDLNNNVAGYCNTFWEAPGRLHFYQADSSGCGAGNRNYCCNNLGEIPSLIIHEWGHGLDAKDLSGMPDPATQEANADFTAALQTHSSCIGSGGWGSNCTGYGDACDSCTGRRDLDYLKHGSNTPWTVTYVQGLDCECNPIGYKGPCGFESYCESGVTSQALWDLVTRDLTHSCPGGPMCEPPGASPLDTASAWQLVERLWFASRNTAKKAYTCPTDCNGPSSNGCFDGSILNVLLDADDCDGDPTNGSPHAAAIFAALGRHDIACDDPQFPYNNINQLSCSGCPTLGAASPLSGTVEACQNILSWNPISGATRYSIFRNEVAANSSYTKIAEVAALATTYSDNSIYQGTDYYYRVQAVGASDDCVGPVSNALTLPAAPCPTACTAPAPPALVSAQGTCLGVSLAWTFGAGTASCNIYRKDAPCGTGYSKIAGPITGTTWFDAGVAPGTSYAYVIKAACDGGGLIESGFSNCLTASRLAPPAAPSSPTVADDCTGLALSWAAAAGATAYDVYRRNNGCGPAGWVVVGTGIKATSWLDTTAKPGSTYGYYIEAVNSCGTVGSSGNCATGTHAAPDISGRVSETPHVKNDAGQWVARPPVYIDKAKVKILNHTELPEVITGPNQQQPDWPSGGYRFDDVQGTPGGDPYEVHAYKVVTVEGIDYEVGYNPLPYRPVPVCKADKPDQDFGLNLYTAAVRGTIQAAGHNEFTGEWTVTAVSDGYWTAAATDNIGSYLMLLPAGRYNIYMQKQCYTSYPPYLSAVVGDQEIQNQNFQITGWQTCGQCYPTLYKDLSDCGLAGGLEDCQIRAVRKFQGCALAKTHDANSALYNSVILSVEVQRAKGQPQEDVKTFTVPTEGDVWINITNGDYFTNEMTVSSAEIAMPPFGTLFGPSEFNKNIFLMKKQVHLTPGEYSISSILRSQPGSYLTLVISDKDIASFPDLP